MSFQYLLGHGRREREAAVPEVVGGDPERMRELGQALVATGEAILDLLGHASSALVSLGFAPHGDDVGANREFWVACNRRGFALRDAGLDLIRRAAELEPGRHCPDVVARTAGFLGLGWVVRTISAVVRGDDHAGDVLLSGGRDLVVGDALSQVITAGTVATGSAVATRVVTSSALPVAGAASIVEAYCLAPVAGSMPVSPVNQQASVSDDEYGLDGDDFLNNSGAAANCQGDCRAQMMMGGIG